MNSYEGHQTECAPAPTKNLGARWSETRRAQHEWEQSEREALGDQRVEDARAFVAREVQKLKSWIRRLGRPSPGDGSQCTVEYGSLFSAVQDDMNALSGTLKTARRLRVVGYQGEHLLQGRDDHVPITLLDESDRRYEVTVSSKGTRKDEEEKDPFAIDAQTHAVVPCQRCNADVLPMDRVGVAGLVLHRKCFQCYLPECGAQLTLWRYSALRVKGEMRFYCEAHYKQMYAVAGDYESGFVQGKTEAHIASEQCNVHKA